VELFHGHAAADLGGLADVVSGRTVHQGEVVFSQGEPGDGFYIVVQGAIELHPSDRSPGERPTVYRTGQGFGELALVHDGPRAATARAAEATALMVIRREDLQSMLRSDSLSARLLRLATAELRSEGGGANAASRIIQRSMLTHDAPQVAGYDIAAGTTLEDAGRGSTVWDSLTLPDGRQALVVLEVRADGLPPAHVLGTARVALRAALSRADDLPAALATANDALAAVHVQGVDQFVECALVVPGAEAVEWACAGRVPAGILGREGTFTQLGSHGPPLGMMAGFGYGTERAPLGSGSAVLVLGGGGAGLLRGAADLVSEVQGKPAGQVVGTIHRAVRRALGGQEISVLFLRKH
jgi:CRP-like cAMP-binding protein